MISYFKRIFLLLVSASATLIQVQAAEQGTVEEMVVTANKLSENLQTSSSAVTVVTADDIRNKGIDSIDAITKVLPNTVNGSFYSGVTDWNYRGLNSSIFKGNNPVIIYVDGIAQQDRRTMFVDMKNVERIEIVHGPSGTVHGKGAMGGVINVITKQANDTFGGEFYAEAAEHGTYDVSAIVSGPLVKEKLYGKVVARKRNYDGVAEYLNRGVSNVNDDRSEAENYLVQLDFFPDEVSRLTLQLNRHEEETGYGRNDVVPAALVNSVSAPDDLDYNTETVRKRETDSQTIKYSRELGNIRIEGQITNRETTWDGIYECDYSSFVSIECFEDQEQGYTDGEIRLVSDNSDIKWVVGAFLGNQERDIGNNGYRFAGFPLANSQGKHEEDTTAVFGQINWRINETWEITAGLRVQEQEYSTNTRYFQAANPAFGVPEINDVSRGSEDESAVLPKFGVSYIINANNTLFASYTEGFLEGGHNDFQTNPSGSADDTYFKPQYNESIEVGYKGDFEKLSLTASIFHMDIEDIHTYTLAAGALYTAGNLKGATSEGVELEATYEITDNWSFDVAYGTTDAEYKSGSLFNGVDASDKTVERTPDETMTVGISYQGGNWSGRVEAQHSGDYYYNFDNNIEIDGRTEVNVRLGWQGENVDVLAFLNNLTDEEGITTVFDVGSLTGVPGSLARSFTRPRTAGVSMRYRF